MCKQRIICMHTNKLKNKGNLEGLMWHLFVCQHLFLSRCPEVAVLLCILPYCVLHLYISVLFLALFLLKYVTEQRTTVVSPSYHLALETDFLLTSVARRKSINCPVLFLHLHFSSYLSPATLLSFKTYGYEWFLLTALCLSLFARPPHSLSLPVCLSLLRCICFCQFSDFYWHKCLW